jgi:NADH:ubiquinone oxidoreductase subunit F (NADH-binding)/NADH:ubiquinone oxidoreductase subunit E
MRLLCLLTAAQSAKGYLTEADLRAVAKEGKVPLHRVQQLVSFYPHFRRTPPKRVTLAVCRDMSCWLAGGEACAARLQSLASDDVEVKEVSCIGRCDRAPAGLFNDRPVELKDESNVAAWIKDPATVEEIVFPSSRKWANDPYASPAEWYSTLLSNPDPNRVIAELKASGLRGMGGAGFPAGTKGEAVRKETRTPKYLICNADESEPGTFKDALILREQPHLVIEGMALAARVVGATRGIIFLRHEYEAEEYVLDAALADARARGVLPAGEFDIEVFVSPGGYILGEETALLECLEDKRGEPRNKPPFPVTQGLFGQPTLINNVETFANGPGIVKNGGAWWAALGTPGCPGPKFIAVSGHVETPGVYQVPLGTTVRELIEKAGGVSGGRKLLAFAPGGASSNFLPADLADVKLSFNDLTQAGSMLGSGALVVVAEGTDLLALAANVVRFFRNESCGKCVPCRVGSEKAVNLLDDVLEGKQMRTALDVLPDLGETMALTSICGLGQVALNPVLSVMRLGIHTA